MANYGEEAEDLAELKGALVVNMGTVTPDGISNYLQAVKAYNAQGGPVLFDPVGAGATRIRKAAVKSLMNGGYFDVIKGNESEITTVFGKIAQQQKGVDSGGSNTSAQDKARLAKQLAAREQNVVLLTGATDYLSDGERTYAIRNGTAYLGEITGSGCTLGTTIAAFLAVQKEDKLLAALSGVMVFEIAAEQAARRSSVLGPGTFVPAFLDELSGIMKRPALDNWSWLAAAKVEEMDV
jgi:thiamine-phosphate diphosphorylase/hydroxyethylthiazole kinase